MLVIALHPQATHLSLPPTAEQRRRQSSRGEKKGMCRCTLEGRAEMRREKVEMANDGGRDVLPVKN